ncbi:transposable element Tcb1 transposase [Trichonephila clavipes]|nr:transposable element Tcb1 transposase [Trichonephila clavipes]
MSRRNQRSAFDQVFDFDRGRIVAYRDCGLPFRENGSRVGRNHTTVMRICDRWILHPPTDTPDQLWERVEAGWSAVPQERIQSLFKSMLIRVAAMTPTMAATPAKILAGTTLYRSL